MTVGRVQHFEIPAVDLPRSAAFYQTVFGWSIRSFDDDTVMIQRPAPVDGEAPSIGGDLHHPTQAKGPTVVVSVESIDEAFARITAAGGSPASQIMDIGQGQGRYAYFDDPEGNRIGLWDAGAVD